MTQNNRTPATGMARALENVCLAADYSRDTAHAPILQARRIKDRFKFSPEAAAEIARLAYGIPEKAERRAW